SRRRLHDEDVGAPDVLVDLERHFRVGKPAEARLANRNPEKRGDVAREPRVRTSGEHLQFAEPGCHERITHHHLQPRDLAGAEGFEPSNTGSKVPRLTAWPRPTVTCRACEKSR